MKTLGILSIFQIIILVVGIISIGYAVGQEFGSVSAHECTLNGVEVDTISDVTGWCLNNSDICNGGSGAWTLKTIECEEFEEEPDEHQEGTDHEDEAHPHEGESPTPGINLVSPVASGATTEVTRRLIERAREAMASGEEVSAADKALAQELGVDISSVGTAASSSPSFLGRYLFGKETGSGIFREDLVTGYVAAGIAVAWAFFSTWIKTGDLRLAKDAALRTAVGVGIGLGAYAALVAFTPLGPAGWIAAGFVAAGIWLSNKFQRSTDRQLDFTCKPWQPEIGGDDCTLCNDKDFPCTEYQCKSLGAGCKLINIDTDDQECTKEDDTDLNSPVITPWEEVLEEGYRYDPLPAGRGVEIKYQNDECLPAFTPFTFGVELNKLGYCRIESERTASFEDMNFADFGGKNLFIKQHSQIMSFPGVAHIQDYLDKLELENDSIIEIINDGEYEFYVRCQAATNGKSNRDEFLFKFCIDKGPDTTSPIIRGFNWNDRSPIGYFSEDEERKVDVQVYVNEPSECKWSHEDKDYKDMENNLTCSDNLLNFNAQLSYTCSGELTGLENNKENDFYFRCNDSFGNVNIQSRKLTLIGTQALIISEISPNNTLIKGGTDSIKVTLEAETSAGDNEGEATCSYSTTGESVSYIRFSDTNSHTHSTNVWLGPGNYDYFIRCIDSSGNSDTKTATFTVETDTQVPIVVRVYHEEQFLKIITNEDSECVYGNSECNYLFDDGILMSSISDREHFTEWNINQNFYIKCRDEFLNEPLPNACNIIARPFEIN